MFIKIMKEWVKSFKKLLGAGHANNPSIWEAKGGGSRVQNQPELLEPVSQEVLGVCRMG